MHKIKGQNVMGRLTLCILGFLTIASIITLDVDLVLERSSHERVKAETEVGNVTPFEWKPGAKVFMEPDLEFLTLVEKGSMIANQVTGTGPVTYTLAKVQAEAISQDHKGLRATTSGLMSTMDAKGNEDVLKKLGDGERIWWTNSQSSTHAGLLGGAELFGTKREYTINRATEKGCTAENVQEGWDHVTTTSITTSVLPYDPPKYYTRGDKSEWRNEPYDQCLTREEAGALMNEMLAQCTYGVQENELGYKECKTGAYEEVRQVGDITGVTYTTSSASWCSSTHEYIQYLNYYVVTKQGEIYEKFQSQCSNNVEAPVGNTRPHITWNPDSIVFASTAAAQTRKPAQELTKFGDSYMRALSTGETAGYKFTLRDDAMSLSDVKVKKEDPSVQQTGNKIYIQKGTSTLILDASTGGTGDSAPNGIAALSYDSAGNEVIGTLASITGAGTTQISIDLSNLMDVNTLGSSKKISLYAEQQNGVKTTDYMSAPYDIEVVVSEEQKLSLDTDSQTKDTVMYGETLELTALVNGGDTTIGWAEDTPLTASIPEVDKSKVEIKSQTWDVKTGQLLVQLNPLVGGDACFQLELNKEASVSDETYLKADSVKTQPIKLKNRPITVTPKGYLLFDGTPFNSDFPWEFETKLSDESMSGNALMNGDTLPYAVEMAALTADTSASPQVDKDGLLTVENGGKEWGLSLKEEDASAIEIFEKKYTVTKNNYHKIDNPTSKLRVDTFKGIKIISNPDDAIANKDDTYRFVIEAKYDVNIPNLEGTTDIEYQGFTYQWEISTDGGAGWHEAPGNGTVSYDDVEGIATITYTGTNAQTDDAGTLFRCKVWNKRDLVNNKKPISKEAELSVRTDPAVFIEIPKTIEMEKKNALLIGTKEMQKIKLVEFDNKISDNKPGKQTTPEGAFQIDTDPTFQLTLIQGVEETRKAIYDVTVYKEDNRTAVTEDRELMILDYKDKKEGGFCVKTKVDNDKPTGTYKGKMVFTITYTPKSISE